LPTQNVPGQVEVAKDVQAGWPEWLRKSIGELESLTEPVKFQGLVAKLAIQEMLLEYPVGQVCDHTDNARIF
jgi:hypothetical protein